jgi:hypothetical protein
MAADANAGQNGSAVLNNQENKAPADRQGYDPTAFASQPGAAARANGYPRNS